DREQAVDLEGAADVHAAREDADREAPEDVDGDDDDRGDGVALHELHRAVHGAVELALALELAPARPRALGVEQPRAEIRVDRELLARHRVEGEARADLRHALAAARD